jgi:hypothetical protein
MAASARRVSGWQATGGERNRRADMGGRTEVLSPLRPFFFTSLVGHRRRPHSPHPSTLTWASRWDSIIFDCFFHFIFLLLYLYLDVTILFSVLRKNTFFYREKYKNISTYKN